MLPDILIKQGLVEVCGSNKVNHYFCDISPVIHLAYAGSYINELVIFICGVLVLIVPLIFIFISYGFIASAILKISSAEGKQKAFSTCASHLAVVSLFYGTLCMVYLKPLDTYSMQDSVATVMYAVVTPMMNPFIYSLRNKDMKGALRGLLHGRRALPVMP